MKSLILTPETVYFTGSALEEHPPDAHTTELVLIPAALHSAANRRLDHDMDPAAPDTTVLFSGGHTAIEEMLPLFAGAAQQPGSRNSVHPGLWTTTPIREICATTRRPTAIDPGGPGPQPPGTVTVANNHKPASSVSPSRSPSSR